MKFRPPTSLLWFWLIILWPQPAPAADAQNAMKVGALELYPTWSAVGLEISYEHDDNNNGSASFVWRKADEKHWRNGVEMTFDRERRLIWASIWPLEQGETIEVKISFEDADAAGLAPITAKTVTRKMVLQPTGGRVFYVSPNGDNANDGTRQKPFKTLAHAAQNAAAGDIVYVMSGVYKEGDLFQQLSGARDNPIVFAAAEGQKPVLDSSVRVEKNSGAWKQHEGDIYKMAIDASAAGDGYVAQDGKRMFRYRSLDELKQDELQAKRAFYYDRASQTLYIRTGSGKSPDAHAYNIAQHQWGLHLERASHVVVRGFEIRNYSGAPVRISGGSHGIVIYGNRIRGGQNGVFIKGETTSNNAVWRNEIVEDGIRDFSWQAVKKSDDGRQGVNVLYAGRGNSVCHNKVDGWFDCIVYLSWKRPDALGIHRDSDVMFNELLNATDDALEMDGGGVNMRVHANRIRNAHTAISLAPVERGPCYVTRNDATYHSLLFKMSVGGATSHGWTYCYHNSGYTLDSGNGGSMIRFAPQKMLPCSNKVFKNNAMIGSEWSVRDWVNAVNYILDYNCYYNTPQTGLRPFQADGRRLESLEEFRAASGQETHGIYADPQFVSTPGLGLFQEADAPPVKDISAADMRLKPTSPCLDKGAVIRGINDDFKGKAPDIGAFEHQ
jgi:hypothetical protein